MEVGALLVMDKKLIAEKKGNGSFAMCSYGPCDAIESAAEREVGCKHGR